MLDFSNLSKYRENNRIEVKKAQGGLPNSIWETYSAFANTLGGVILLGVEELADKSFNPIGLSNPEKMEKEFWDIVNNSKKVSTNILTSRNVYIKNINNKNILVIEIPKAKRYDKPVYIDGNPLTGTYRRNGEGDYHCSENEVRSMTRDASYKTQDMLVLNEMSTDVFNYESVRSYRMRIKNLRPGHVWETLEDIDFLYRLGAADKGEDGNIHPTAAGLLMFGNEYEIVKEFPYYFLDYQEHYSNNPDIRWTDRIVSSSGEWSGNLHDFFFNVYNKLTFDLKRPFKIENGIRIDDTSVHIALREALANSLINADYYGSRGLVVIKTFDTITISNPGNFRIELDEAKSGGISDPRNSALMKMFNLINIGERAGSGIPTIYQTWKSHGWIEPILSEEFDPARTTLTLFIQKNTDKKPPIKAVDKKPPIKTADKKVSAKTLLQFEIIIDYLTVHVTATSNELAELIGVKNSRIKEILHDLISKEIIIANGSNRNRTYSLKS